MTTPTQPHSRPTNNQLLYKAHFRWKHYTAPLSEDCSLPVATGTYRRFECVALPTTPAEYGDRGLLYFFLVVLRCCDGLVWWWGGGRAE